MPEFNPINMGGTMRLGSRKTNFVVSSVVKEYLRSSILPELDGDVDVSTCNSQCEELLDNPNTDAGGCKENFSYLLPEFNSFRLVNADHIYARHRHR